MNYEIKGNELPVVICRLAEGEAMVTESGSMSWMSSNMKMETVSGGAKSAFGRMLSGEKFFQNRYTASGGEGLIAFASSFPGSILAVEIGPGKGMIAQKSAFLASEEGVKLSVYVNDNVKSGVFGGEGFIMQRLTGEGTAFLEIDGSMVSYDLAEGQSMIVDTGHLAAMDESVTLTAVKVSGAKNVLFGGEGLFNTCLTGPGRIVLQTMPLSNVAGALAPFMELGD